MRLKTLKPDLRTLNTQVARSLSVQETTPRPAGRGWQETRRRIQVRDDSVCADCGLIWRLDTDHVDHEVPRWKAPLIGMAPGEVDADTNLRLRCLSCHDKKTKAEAAERAALGLPPLETRR